MHRVGETSELKSVSRVGKLRSTLRKRYITSSVSGKAFRKRGETYQCLREAEARAMIDAASCTTQTSLALSCSRLAHPVFKAAQL